MTSVYGVTMYGAKLQIYKQISTLPEESLPGELHLPASVYLARCTFKALEEMFSSARSIQVCIHERRYFLNHYMCCHILKATQINV